MMRDLVFRIFNRFLCIHKKRLNIFVFSVLIYLSIFPSISYAQVFDILLKGGHVIDPKNNINELMDVAIRDNKIAAVRKEIDVKDSKEVVFVQGMYVTPGLIDLHSHNFPGIRPGDPDPDGFTFPNGVTTTVDAGSSGWKSFPDFKKQTIDRSETRVLAFLNIVGEGFRGGHYEQDTTDMNAKLSAEVAKNNSQHIVGFKVAHYNGHSWVPIDRAIEAGNIAGGLPVMVDFGSARPALSLEELLMKRFRPGDIYTHTFGGGSIGREAIIDASTKELRPFVLPAQKRGIIFDVGFGGRSFSFEYALSALNANFYPNTIGTDMNHSSLNTAMKSILNVMSAFLALDMDLSEIIKASTIAPANAIRRSDLGHLSIGAVADIAVLNIRYGDFGFWDRENHKINGSKMLECELTLREGKVVYDFRGISIPNSSLN